MDARLIAPIIGIVGAGLGVACVVADAPALGGIAGMIALLAGATAMLSGIDRDRAKEHEDGWAIASQLASTTRDLDAARNRITDLEAERDAATAAAATAGTGVGAIANVGGPAPGAPTVALTDPASDLFSEAYFHVALESRLAAARRHLRPVAVGLVCAAEGSPGDTVVPPPPTRLADAIRETIRDADIACRLDDGTFAVILEDTPENGAVWTVERIRRNLVSRFGSHTMWAGVACYPAHAFSADDLFEQAHTALLAAQDWKQDRIEVALSD